MAGRRELRIRAISRIFSPYVNYISRIINYGENSLLNFNASRVIINAAISDDIYVGNFVRLHISNAFTWYLRKWQCFLFFFLHNPCVIRLTSYASLMLYARTLPG